MHHLFRKSLALASLVAVLTPASVALADDNLLELHPAAFVSEPAVSVHYADGDHFTTELRESNYERWWAQAAKNEWNKKVAENEARDRAEAAAAASSRRTRSTAHSGSATASAPSDDSGGRHYLCPQYASSDNPSGDFAVPCNIVGRESHGSYTADNPNSSAYGAYQIMHLPPGTPPAEQDRIARGMALCNWHPETNYCAGG